MDLANSGTQSMKIHLLKITKCFTHYICYKYNVKNDFNLKFKFFSRQERNSFFRFELSSLVTLSKHWL